VTRPGAAAGLPAGEARATADAVARRSYGRLVAFLAARTRDVAAAEDALSGAFAAALADWPVRGCPSNPEAWLMTVARRRLIDADRRRQSGAAAGVQLRLLSSGLAAADAPGGLPDDRLALLFVCAHPALDPGVRPALMLQTVLGLDAARIASAFLTSPAAMAKRLVRAKAKIREAGLRFAVPDRAELPPRLDAVLQAIYAAFAEGWADPSDPLGRDLTGEALFLARLVAGLMPDEPEALGLLALVLHAHARRRARRAADAYVPLAEQDTAAWDAAMIAEAEALLRRAGTHRAIGRFQLEAALQSAHVAGRRSGRPDWPAIVRLYDGLLALSGSPVVALNRAMALAARDGPAEGLAVLDGLAADARLADYQPYWAARADLLARVGETGAARAAYGLAIGLTPDPAARAFLERRRATLPDEGRPGGPPAR
jgi:RNA polymerase sigma-70 factor (ECF subfamily)